MRQIHPVGFHEKFVASGVYTYYHNYTPTGSAERWSIHELPDGAQLIRVDQNWVSGSPKNILIEAWQSPLENIDSRIERVDIAALGSEGKQGKATYIFEAGRVQVGYSVDGKYQQNEVLLPSNCIPSVNSTLFVGFQFAIVARANGECVPIYACHPFLTYDVKVEKVGAVIGETDTLSVTGKLLKARRYQIVHPCSTRERMEILSENLPSAWIDKHNIVLKTEDLRQESIVAMLTQYARRPEPPKS